MKKFGKVMAVMLAVVFSMNMTAYRAYADADQGEWKIEHKLDVAECGQGDTVNLTVYLQQGSSSLKQQDLSVLEGVLEYDNSLFTVDNADIQPLDSGKVVKQSFDAASCVFRVEYDSDITVASGAPFLQIALHVNGNASTGKTTVCVTHLEWRSAAAAQATAVEHRVPSSITIAEADNQTVFGDVNQDNKINLVDVKYIMQNYNGTRTLSSQQKLNADVNQDGKVNLVDAKLIMKYYNGEIQKF